MLLQKYILEECKAIWYDKFSYYLDNSVSLLETLKQSSWSCKEITTLSFGVSFGFWSSLIMLLSLLSIK